MSFIIIRDDIENVKADVIVNIKSPKWIDGRCHEFEQLRDSYINALNLAVEKKCESIAFPLISIDEDEFLNDRALEIVISMISEFILEHEIKVILVVNDDQPFELSGQIFDDVDEFVISQEAEEGIEPECAMMRNMEMECFLAAPQIETPRSLDDVMEQVGENFSQRLLRLIDEKNLTDVYVYKRANLDRKLFSKIRCNPNYKPKKKTAVALAISLKLNLDETKDLLERAGLALSPCDRFDMIVSYFIENEVFDIYTINLALFKYDQPLLGE